MAEEEKDIYFGTPKEIVDFAKVLVPKMAGMMALMAQAVHEKWGDEAIEVIVGVSEITIIPLRAFTAIVGGEAIGGCVIGVCRLDDGWSVRHRL